MCDVGVRWGSIPAIIGAFDMPKILVRPKEAMRRLGVGHSFFWQEIVGTGRLNKVQLGRRAVAFLESDLDQLIGEMVAATPPAPPRRRLTKVAGHAS
ncbi:transcriptional regulator, AlpA family [Rhizobiales bacterium GAS113]|nr:transcriptional regulator, AlpA family [Rhizobiales bacterium GAS113]